MRILTRLLPYIYEAEHLQEWEDNFFWKARKPTQIWDKKRNKAGGYFDGLNPAKKIRLEDDDEYVSEREIGPPLGEQLIDLLVRYMFLPNFTLPKKLDAEGLPDLKVAYHIWNSGIGCRQSVGMTRENEKNAVEVIRLLLALCSRQLYIPARESPLTSKIAMKCASTQPKLISANRHRGRHRRKAAVLYDSEARQTSGVEHDMLALEHCMYSSPSGTKTAGSRLLLMVGSCQCRDSLLTLVQVLKYNPATWRVPVDFSTEGDPKSRLANLSLDLLLVLILYPDPTGEANAYRKSIGRLHRVEDFQFIQQGLTTVLMQPVCIAPHIVKWIGVY